MSATTLDTPHHAERRTRAVALLTAATMGVEVAAGWWFNSMALLADGWHMGTHAAAIGLSALAYGWARRRRRDPCYAFGAWKIEILAAFASAVALLAASVAIAAGSVERLLLPQPIRYAEALGVAALGLVVNLVCAWMLGAHHHGPDDAAPGHAHGHAQADPHAHPQADAHWHAPAHANGGASRSRGDDAQGARHVHHDLNLRSAYLHVVADAATSALAIVALAGGLWLGWRWLDPAMGLVGALMVARWGALLVRDTSRVLLDREMDHPLVAEWRRTLEEEAPWGTRTRLAALRAWRIGRAEWSLVLHLETTDPALTVERVRCWLLRRWPQVAQLTVQIEPPRVSSSG